MLPRLLHRETLAVTRVTSGVPDKHGVPTVSTTTQVWAGCNVQPTSTAVERGNVEVVQERWRVSGPPAPWLDDGDQVRWAGRDFRIDGAPGHFGGTGVLDHTEAVLIAWKG